jgi:predicted transposase/invertase (TIGR01784 family)
MVKQKLDNPPRTIRKKRKPKVRVLFQAHDKFFKIAFQDKENAGDFLKTYFMPQFPDISLDLDTLHLDDAQHVSSKLHPLFSDVIYRCQLKDDITGKIVYVSFLFEHKSKMPTSEFDMRLQLLEYIVAIKRKNKTEKQPESIVIPIVFNQNEKNWEQKPFRNCFPNVHFSLLQFVPEFAYFVFNLAGLPDAQIRILQEYNALRGVLLAMKHYKNLDFLNHHFEEIVKFIEEYPEKEDLWRTVFAYILGNGELDLDIVTNILKNIHSPKIRQKMDLATNKGIFGQAYRQGRDEATAKANVILSKWQAKLQETENKLMIAETIAENAQSLAENAKIDAENAKIDAENARIEAAQNARIEAEKTRVFLSLLHGWHRQADHQLIADIASISLKETQLWIASFEYIKTNRAIQTTIAPKQWCKLLEKKKTKYAPLSEAQVTRLLELLDKSV